LLIRRSGIQSILTHT
jgi:NADH dehydrogenase FAD-containing subunit